MTIPKVMRSTENPNKVSLTLQGTFVILIIYAVHQLGFDISGNDAAMFFDIAITIIAGVATMLGIIRKVMNGKLHG